VLALLFAVGFTAMFGLATSVAPPPSASVSSVTHATVGTSVTASIEPAATTRGYRSALEIALAVAAFITLVVGIGWTMCNAVRRGPWTPRTQARSEAAVVASTSPWWYGGSVDCAGGSSDHGSCGDFSS
jgi:hypothetical protein